MNNDQYSNGAPPKQMGANYAQNGHPQNFAQNQSFPQTPNVMPNSYYPPSGIPGQQYAPNHYAHVPAGISPRNVGAQNAIQPRILAPQLTQMEVIAELEQKFKMMLGSRKPCHMFFEDFLNFSHFHYQYSIDIVEQFYRAYKNIRQSGDQDPGLIDIIQEIIKHIQGDYIIHFSNKIQILFPMIWQMAHNDDQKVKLLKIFKIWGMFFDNAVLQNIQNAVNLSQYEQKLLTTEHQSKIANFKKEFKPNMKFIHQQLLSQGRVISGSNTPLYREQNTIKSQTLAKPAGGSNQTIQELMSLFENRAQQPNIPPVPQVAVQQVDHMSTHGHHVSGMQHDISQNHPSYHIPNTSNQINVQNYSSEQQNQIPKHHSNRGFLNSLFSSFTEYNSTQIQQVENQILQYNNPNLHDMIRSSQRPKFLKPNQQPQYGAPKFDLSMLKANPQVIKEYNIIAVNQLYQGIKFQCSNCGLRFIRNEALKAHLDQHFIDNNEVRKKKRHNPAKQENRPLFNSFQSWISPPLRGDGQIQNQSDQKEQLSIVPYQNSETSCYMCKEKLKVENDCNLTNNDLQFNNASGQKSIGQSVNASGSGQNGILNKISDENHYFINAKKIRISTRNKTTQIIEKQDVIVHLQCFQQLELIKQQKAKAKTESVLGKRQPKEQDQMPQNLSHNALLEQKQTVMTGVNSFLKNMVK